MLPGAVTSEVATRSRRCTTASCCWRATLLARYRHLSTHVQDALDATSMCVVMGCPMQENAKKTHKALHACADHEKPDCQVRGTEEVVRLCTACRAQRNVEVFRELQGSERMGGCCERCTVRRRNKEGKNVPPLVAPDHKPPSAAELANGEDPDGTFIRERRVAEHRLVGDDACPGETMSIPLLVLAVHDPAHKGHEKECVRVGCDNAAKFNVDRCNGQEVIRPDPTLRWLLRGAPVRPAQCELMCILVLCIHLFRSHRAICTEQSHTVQGVTMVQGIRSDQFCLVAVVDKHGCAPGSGCFTGGYMWVLQHS